MCECARSRAWELEYSNTVLPTVTMGASNRPVTPGIVNEIVQ